MVMRVLDHVAQCYTAKDGFVIARLVSRALTKSEKAILSFDGVSDVPSSFVNAAFVSLLDDFSFDQIRANLAVINSTRQINDMILRRMRDGAARRARTTSQRLSA